MSLDSESGKPEDKEDFGMYTAMHQAIRLSPLERFLRITAEHKSGKKKESVQKEE